MCLLSPNDDSRVINRRLVHMRLSYWVPGHFILWCFLTSPRVLYLHRFTVHSLFLIESLELLCTLLGFGNPKILHFVRHCLIAMKNRVPLNIPSFNLHWILAIARHHSHWFNINTSWRKAKQPHVETLGKYPKKTFKHKKEWTYKHHPPPQHCPLTLYFYFSQLNALWVSWNKYYCFE